MNTRPGYMAALVVVAIVAMIAATYKPEQAIPIIGFAGMIATGIFQLLKQDQAAVKVAEVAVTQEENNVKVDRIGVTVRNTERAAQAIHTLVNSQTAEQLKAYALLARAFSDDKPTDSIRSAAADEAERVYEAHMEKQSTVDAAPDSAPTDTGFAKKKKEEEL